MTCWMSRPLRALIARSGSTFFHVGLEDLCDRLAGRASVEVMSEIVEYISEPAGRYRTG